MIKYLGSKRRLVPVLRAMVERSGARRALDLFTGTTRVAQAFKAAGAEVTAVDRTRCAEVLAQTYVATDAGTVDRTALERALAELDALQGVPGYVTDTFCVRSRFFQPHNGARIDAIRQAIDERYRDDPLHPVLLTSLIEAADRVDSTTGLQMAYVKAWAPRSFARMTLRPPVLLAGPGHAVRADACAVAGDLGPFDFAYLDPPYNQHRYESNYHIWETLVAWDAPEHYGVACKRVDLRDPERSPFNRRATFAGALASVVKQVQARVLVLSYNDEAWVGPDELVDMCAVRGDVAVLGFPSDRYVGARIGVHDPRGRRVGTPGRLRNVELLVVAGDRAEVRRVVAPWRDQLVRPVSGSFRSVGTAVPGTGGAP
ncbi:MAG: DNA adenine methylase [Actinomycetota bacterium]|nr:DNA adenine methylase [Actinomycetota bacterium]MDA8279518.1 DNA adenine methylase [Actinomycetota bacterium]